MSSKNYHSTPRRTLISLGIGGRRPAYVETHAILTSQQNSQTCLQPFCYLVKHEEVDYYPTRLDNYQVTNFNKYFKCKIIFQFIMVHIKQIYFTPYDSLDSYT